MDIKTQELVNKARTLHFGSKKYSKAIRKGEEVAVKSILKNKIPKLSDEQRLIFEKTGFSLGKVFGKYQDVTFPEGWKIKYNDKDSRHSTIVNDKDVIFAYIFIKETFYDSFASIRLA